MLHNRISLISMMFLLFLAAVSIWADEGMWPLYDLGKLPLDSLRMRGLTLNQEQIYTPKGGGIADAVIEVGAGSGSFISSNGLIITNHHVAFQAIQQQSRVDKNYIRDGFYAASFDQELPAVGYYAHVTLSMEDVTAKVKAVLKDKMSDIERYKAVEKITKKIIKDAEKGRDVECEVSKMFGGMQYILYNYLKIKDVRIVYVPPYAIGNFGGDIDNWIWPRHTGDFSFLRAYVSPDGSTADYSTENVPYHPEIYFPISSQGIKEGDFTMIMGFPGYTDRYASSYDLDNLINHEYPLDIRTYEDELAIFNEAGARDSSVAIRLAETVSGINNTLKNSYGMMEGFKKADILNTKRTTEQQLTRFLEENPELLKEYGGVLPQLDSLHREKRLMQDRDFALEHLRYGSDFYYMAYRIYRWASEKEKPDIERDPDYQNRDSASTHETLENMQINLVPETDKKILKYFLKKALDLPPDQKIATLENIFSGKQGDERDQLIDRFLDSLYTHTAIGNLEKRLTMFNMPLKQLENLNDPLLGFAKALKPDMDAMRERGKRFSGAENRLTPKLIAAYTEWKKGNLYPDANGSMRFNYGFIKGYNPRDAVRYNWLTGLNGVMEKETGKDPFIVPQELKQAHLTRDFGSYIDPSINDIPVDFLSTNDGTGGNSGSPCLNGKGEIIGLVFDGNYESISMDYLFNPNIVRSIQVDIRYVLFLIDRVYHLDALMKELTIH